MVGSRTEENSTQAHGLLLTLIGIVRGGPASFIRIATNVFAEGRSDQEGLETSMKAQPSISQALIAALKEMRSTSRVGCFWHLYNLLTRSAYALSTPLLYVSPALCQKKGG